MSTVIRVGGVPEHFNLPWKLALEDKAFAPTGADVRYSDYPAGTGELTRALRENELDVALVLTEGAVLDALQNGDNALVKVYVNSPLVWGIHVAAKSTLTKTDDLRNKRVAISRYGSGSHLIAIVDAAERGWPTDTMTFGVVEDLQGARKALAAGEVDVFLWERHMTQPLVDNGEFRRIGQREVPWPAFVVSVRRRFLSASGSTVRAVLDIVARYAANLKRRGNAASLIADRYNIHTHDAATWLAGVRWGNSYRRPNAALLRVATALQAQHVLEPGPFDADKIWTHI